MKIATTNCSYCGANNPEKAVFCKACGQKLDAIEPATTTPASVRNSVTCKHCGIENLTEAAFCKKCGKLINALDTGTPFAPASIVGNRANKKILIVCLAVLCAAAGIVLILNRPKQPMPIQEPVQSESNSVTAEAHDNEAGDWSAARDVSIEGGACTYDHEDAPTNFIISLTDRQKAELASNVNNLGLFTFHESWIYFRTGRYMEDSGSTYGLYRIHQDGGNAELIYDGPNWHTSADAEAVYLIDHKRDRRLIRIDLRDGTKKVLANFKVRKALLVDDYIYGARADGGLFRVKKDGASSPETYPRIQNNLTSFSVSNQNLYFVDDDKNVFMRFNNDGAETLLNGVKKAIMQGDHAYYLATNDFLYSWDSRTGETKRLTNAKARYYVVSGDTVYFTNSDRNNQIYSVSVEGENHGMICSKPAIELNIVGDRLFFINIENDTSARNDEYQLWCVKTNGSDNKSLESWLYD